MSGTSSHWRSKIRNEDAAGIIKKACPPFDNVGKLKPVQVVKGGDDGPARSFYTYIPPQLCASLLPPSPSRGGLSKPTAQLRIILAIHGFGGRPLQEIKKWRNASISLNSVILAPEGTLTESTHRLGWNAHDCCGDPVVNEIDDVDFITNGVVEVFLGALKEQGDDARAVFQMNNINVVATGFSNGGFVSSLLGLLPGDDRPSWLVGILPTGGYQYDVDLYLYGGIPRPHPLPMMAHHGGRDSIVIPDGCCAESKCQLDIGINQTTCTSVQNAFEMWSHINGCSSYALDDEIVINGQMEKVDKGKNVTCWKGQDCDEPTNLCLWNNEGHAWGFQFPGIEIAQTWVHNVFHDAEMRSKTIDNHGNNLGYTPSISHSKKGKTAFSVAFALLGLLLLLFCMSRKMHCFLGNGRKRKSSKSV